jgi:DUF971 family protein
MQIQPTKQQESHVPNTVTNGDGLLVWDHKGVVVVWPDGHCSRLPWAVLRAVCQCTECRQQREEQG